ncbi:hypothetical protein SB766_30470, partial [Pseudomonas sp. SIMBA_077]
AADEAELTSVHDTLAKSTDSATNMHDRKYFKSLYVREPGGTLIELATDKPGMLVDEPAPTLGTKLFLPPKDSIKDLKDLKV